MIVNRNGTRGTFTRLNKMLALAGFLRLPFSSDLGDVFYINTRPPFNSSGAWPRYSPVRKRKSGL